MKNLPMIRTETYKKADTNVSAFLRLSKKRRDVEFRKER